MISDNTRVIGVEPSITVDQFHDVLAAAGSPASLGYDIVAGYGVDPAFALAIFHHESRYATDPAAVVVRYDTRNPGNCRTSRTGQGTIINTDRGQFVKYASWEDGWRDLAYRLIDPRYVYAAAGLVTIRRIIERFAPPEDGNDPEAYIAAVVADMNAWAAVEQLEQLEKEHLSMELWYPGAVRLSTPNQGAAPDQHRVWPAGVDRIVMHHTDGAEQSVLSWFQNPASEVSAHLFITRAGKVYQFVAFDQIAWHAGTKPMNTRSVGIEHEQYRVSSEQGGWSTWTAEQLGTSAAVVAWLLDRLPASTQVIPHSAVVSTGCPGDLDVPHILELAGAIRRGVAAVKPAPSYREFPQTGKRIQGGFLRFWEAYGGLPIFGYPLTNEERDEHGLTVQWFERARFEWHPGSDPSRWDVVLGRVGAELREARSTSR